MIAKRKATLPKPDGNRGRAASKQQLHNSHFSRKYKEIDWFFLSLIIVYDAAILAVGLALVFGSRGAL
ncbi:MAG: hypothetical protein ACWGKN_02585 [Desulfoprunum sp.]|jgi:hypothetical protein